MRNAPTIIANTQDLIQKLTEAREKHSRDYQEAVSGWKTQVLKRLKKEIRSVKTGTDANLQFHDVQKPESHLTDYDDAIEMLKMHSSETIELTSEQFQTLVRDRWAWRKEWVFSNTKYLNR